MNRRVSESDEEGLRSFVLPLFGEKKLSLSSRKESLPGHSAKDRQTAANRK